MHERSIQIVSGDNESKFENLLEKNKEKTINQRNLQVLMIRSTNHNFFIFTENTHNLRNFQIILNEI